MSEYPYRDASIYRVARDIRAWAEGSIYDHRPFLPPKGEDPRVHTEGYRLGYAVFKYAVALVLQPKSILEIGVRSGVSAMAFLTGAPKGCVYTGIDNASSCQIMDFDFLDWANKQLRKQGFNPTILIQDSQKLSALPSGHYDLVHVDGDHSYEGAYHDMELAWKADSEWILVDDARDIAVTAAVMKCLYDLERRSYSWAYFEDTWTGNILVHREKQNW